MSQAEQYHSELVSLIHELGEKFPKKHGNWIKLNLDNNCFLQMDSWNKQIHLKQGTGIPKNKELHKFNDVCGFEGKVWMGMGMAFGGFTGTGKEVQIKAMINRVNNFLNSKQ